MSFTLHANATRIISAIVCICYFNVASGQSEEKSKQKSNTNNNVYIEYDTSENSSNDATMIYTPPIETIADNPVVAMGLTSGAEAINRSVESLLDSVFYSLLDNQRNFYFDENSWLQIGLQRRVFSTSNGNYIVFDRFQVGPEHLRDIARFEDIPIKFGADANSEFLQIYIRSDGLRVHETDTLPFWRRSVNQWLGFLPFLSTVLPPSFNPNELYDPLKQISTPFVFPFGTDAFYKMPVGSIRSYAISGGARVFADIGDRLPTNVRDELRKVGGLNARSPYSIFVRGEHRINVLRRSDSMAWVGIKNIRRAGHILSTSLSEQVPLLKGLFSLKMGKFNWVWQGRPVLVLPLDMALEQALGFSFDQVFQFDLNKAPARAAYEAAVKGDFSLAHLSFQTAKKSGLYNGVGFHFSRNQKRQEFRTEVGPNVALYNKRRTSELAESKVEITDALGTFDILEASHDTRDKSWDVLLGEKEKRLQQTLEIRVKKTSPRTNTASNGWSGEDSYVYVDREDDPFRLSIMLTIQDRNIVASDLVGHLDRLKDISFLSMDKLPVVKIIDPHSKELYRSTRPFVGPDLVPFTPHVMPTLLGRFGAQLLVHLSGNDIKGILNRTEDEMWSAFATSFGFRKDLWATQETRSSWIQKLWWSSSFVGVPLRLLGIRFESLDAFHEADFFVSSMQSLKKYQLPLQMLEGFGRLLNTPYPEILTKALLLLANPEHVARRIVLSTDPKKGPSQEEMRGFSKMNQMVFMGGPPMPKPSRYNRAKEKLAGFYLDQPQSNANLPQIMRIDVSAVDVPKTLRLLEDGSDLGAESLRPGEVARHVQMRVAVKGVPKEWPIKFFLKIKEAGRLKLGKFELAEEVFEVPPVAPHGRTPGVSYYDVYLTGPLSPMKGLLLNRAVELGGSFEVIVSVSIDGVKWGDPRPLEFRFENGRLLPRE